MTLRSIVQLRVASAQTTGPTLLSKIHDEVSIFCLDFTKSPFPSQMS
jgi:hypothetical protein